MESRLASGTGDARKIKAAAASLAESLPTAAVLGDVDALAARLTTIARARGHRRCGREGQAGGTPRRPDRPQGGAGRRGRGAGDELARSGRPPVTGCARFSTSGARSAAWTARPTTRCGSVIRRPGKPSTAAAARISPSWTASGRAPVRPRRRCANAPRNWPTPPTGARPSAAFRDLLTEWKAAGRASKDVDDALWQRFKAAQDTFFTARNAVSAERDAEFRANAEAKEALLARGREARHLGPGRRARRAAHHRRQVGQDRQGAPRAQRRPGAAAARGREEGARRAVARRRSGGPGSCRPIPGTRRTIRAASGEGRGGGPRPRTPRRRGPAPSNGGSGRRRRPRRSARRAS